MNQVIFIVDDYFSEKNVKRAMKQLKRSLSEQNNQEMSSIAKNMVARERPLLRL